MVLGDHPGQHVAQRRGLVQLLVADPLRFDERLVTLHRHRIGIERRKQAVPRMVLEVLVARQRGTVSAKVFLGDSVDFQVRVGDCVLLARVHPSLRTPVGDPIFLRIIPQKCIAVPGSPVGSQAEQEPLA